jgi:uncharacterized damage-inducible protein DinB
MRLLIAIVLLGFLQTASAQDAFLKEYLIKWQNSAQYTIEVAEAMPEDKYDFKPTPEVRSFREQVVHIMNNMVWLSSSYLSNFNFKGDLKNKEMSKEEIIMLLRQATIFSQNAVKSLEAKDLDDKVDFFAGPLTKRQILVLMSDHMTHHRGQVVVYLRLNHIKPPRYRGW